MGRWIYETRTNSDGQTVEVGRLQWNGFSTKHYMTEHERYAEFYNKVFPSKEEANKIVKKLRRHFKLDFTTLFVNQHNGCFLTSAWNGNIIKLPTKNISLGIICHEVAHALDKKKWGWCNNHNKKFRTCMKRVCLWAKRYL